MYDKIWKKDDLARKISTCKKQGKKIVFTNGCFDIIHVGHVRYLKKARAQGDLLIIGLNSDSSVKLIKGNKRPIINENQRAEVLCSLACVDYVTVFNEPDPLELIKTLKPDVLVKGADWPEDKIVGASEVKASGGTVQRIDFVPGISTTEIIDRIIKCTGLSRKEI